MPLRLCRLVTIPSTFVVLLPSQLKMIHESGIEITLVSSPGVELEAIQGRLGVRSVGIPMTRQPSPINDLKSLIALTKFFQRNKFDIVHSSTPKAGLLTAIAGWLAGVPIRIHTYTGQIWIEMTGLARILMRWIDWLIGTLSTHTYADSFSQRDLLIKEGLIAPHKIDVIANGSISGVDLVRFDPQVYVTSRSEIRRQLHIPDGALIIVFVGRVNRDKGVNELVAAFRRLREQHDDLHLLLVGPFETDRTPLLAETLDEILSNVNIHVVGFTRKPELYLAASDIFCLPSYREGFGSVAIEAGVMSLPSVVTAVIGLVDAIVDNETGLIVPPKNIKALVNALEQMIMSSDLRQRMGQAARVRALNKYDAKIVNQAMVNEYFWLMRHKGSSQTNH